MPAIKRFVLRGHVWLFATLLPLAVRLAPLHVLVGLLVPPPHARPYRGVSVEQIGRLVAGRLGRPRNMRRRACLREGLTLFHFLRLADWPATVHFAVFPPAGPTERMHAHCWVSLDGRAISQPPAGPYTLLMSYPPAKGRVGNLLPTELFHGAGNASATSCRPYD